MAQPKNNLTTLLQSGHNALIVPPLAVILVSCFVFVLVQPNSLKQTGQTSSTTDTPVSHRLQTALPMAQNVPLPLIEPSVGAVDPATASTPSSITTASPQPTTSSRTQLQDASGYSQSLTKRINVPTHSKDKDRDD